jgi:hypothetical protein
MLSLELSRSIYLDRQRQIERSLRHRRLLELLAARAAEPRDDASPARRRVPRAIALDGPVVLDSVR